MNNDTASTFAPAHRKRNHLLVPQYSMAPKKRSTPKKGGKARGTPSKSRASSRQASPPTSPARPATPPTKAAPSAARAGSPSKAAAASPSTSAVAGPSTVAGTHTPTAARPESPTTSRVILSQSHVAMMARRRGNGGASSSSGSLEESEASSSLNLPTKRKAPTPLVSSPPQLNRPGLGASSPTAFDQEAERLWRDVPKGVQALTREHKRVEIWRGPILNLKTMGRWWQEELLTDALLRIYMWYSVVLR